MTWERPTDPSKPPQSKSLSATGFWDLQKRGELIGEYIEKRSSYGKYHSMVYVVRRRNGERWAVWGNAKLDSDMRWIKIGETVSISKWAAYVKR